MTTDTGDTFIRAFAVLEHQLRLAMISPTHWLSNAFTRNIMKGHSIYDSVCEEGSRLAHIIGTDVAFNVGEIYHSQIRRPCSSKALPREPPRRFFHQQVCNYKEGTTLRFLAHLWFQYGCTIYPQTVTDCGAQAIVYFGDAPHMSGSTIITRILQYVNISQWMHIQYRLYVLYLLLPMAEALPDASERIASLDAIYKRLSTYAGCCSTALDAVVVPNPALPPPLQQMVLSYCMADTATLLVRLAAKLHTPAMQAQMAAFEAYEVALKTSYAEQQAAEQKAADAEYHASPPGYDPAVETRRRQAAVAKRRGHGRGRHGRGGARLPSPVTTHSTWTHKQ